MSDVKNDPMAGEVSGPTLSRRELLRGMVGGAALAAGGLLAGCGGGTSNGVQNTTNTPFQLGFTPSRMLVSTFLLGSVESFDPNTGASQGTYLPAQGQGITTAGIVLSGSNVFVFSPGGDRVFILDRNSGNLKGLLGTPQKGLITPHSGAIGPDGALYAVNAPTLNNNVGKGTDGIEKFDPGTGQYMGRFADIRSPFGIIFSPDGQPYVSSTLVYAPQTPRTDYVTRLNARTGATQRVVVQGTKIPFTMAFHPSGDLLVVEHFDSRIQRYDAVNGRLVGTFINVNYPVGITYGPNSDLYVGSFSTPDRFPNLFTGNIAAALGGGSVQVFDGTTGAYKRTLVSGLPFAGFVAFV